MRGQKGKQLLKWMKTERERDVSCDELSSITALSNCTTVADLMSNTMNHWSSCRLCQHLVINTGFMILKKAGPEGLDIYLEASSFHSIQLWHSERSISTQPYFPASARLHLKQCQCWSCWTQVILLLRSWNDACCRVNWKKPFTLHCYSIKALTMQTLCCAVRDQIAAAE